MTTTKLIQYITKNKIKNRPTWDDYFMSIAYLTSSRSACNRLHVGCVLVKNKYIISTGYNGFIAGVPHTSIVKDGHEQATIHAEQNAISNCAKRGVCTDNAIAYITHYPCINCFKTLASSGIKEIRYSENYKNDNLVNKLSKISNISIIQMVIVDKIQ